MIDEASEARGLRAKDFAAIGITNQRETTVVWNRETGIPIYNALVWQDTRVADTVAAFAKEGGPDRFREKTGFPSPPTSPASSSAGSSTTSRTPAPTLKRVSSSSATWTVSSSGT